MTLPSDRGGPVTQEVGFFACNAATFADWIRAVMGQACVVRKQHWSGLEDAVTALAPGGPRNKYASVAIENWALLLTNGPLGTDVGMLPSHAARELGVRAIRAVCVDGDEEKFPARILEVFGPQGPPPLALERSVVAANDGGKWVFETSGVAFDFEDLKAYGRRLKAARFTAEMLGAYLRALEVPVDVEPSWRDANFIECGV